MKRTPDTLVVVALNAGRLVVAITEHAQAGDMPDDIQQAVNDLVQ
jgi:hypothetical protein